MRLCIGAFVRVRSDHANESRRGLDGMVIRDFGGGDVGLIFGFDRNNRPQRAECCGTELWRKSELDLKSVEV